ncbi:hypothetical protein J7K28_04450 [Candidatus Aerophobetes bacterium]|nr:hypothetical protein [Candidatus Aerophobetes bacterium]
MNNTKNLRINLTLRKTILPKLSMARMKFATLSSSLVIKKIGHLAEKDEKEIFKIIRRMLGSSVWKLLDYQSL